jgi:hypothetical protein
MGIKSNVIDNDHVFGLGKVRKITKSSYKENHKRSTRHKNFFNKSKTERDRERQRERDNRLNYIRKMLGFLPQAFNSILLMNKFYFILFLILK